MSKVIAIDYGSKKVGIAISDISQKIAFSLDTVSNENLFSFLEQLFKNEKISLIVVGNPLSLKNTENKISSDIHAFINKLKQKFSSIKIDTIDERYTSVIAKKSIVNSELPYMKRRNKNLVDKISATIILQDYLDNYN